MAKQHPEYAVESLKDDVLHRDQFARRLVRTLISEKTRKASGNVVGLAGSWGAGKSSVLNFVEEQILAEYPEAIVVRFNPWLVSGRNDLVREFLSELLAMIARSKGKIAQSEQLMKVLVDYGMRLSPVLDFVPGGAAAKGVVQAASSLLERGDSLAALRKRLLQELTRFPEPIVALVDEVDRVEDAEIHALAQLVRSIADFPNVSYLLAYDATRVAEALGNGSPERGRSYLEKIIQLQIPIPALAPQEMVAVLRTELAHIEDFSLPKDFLADARYVQMEELLILRVLPTLRDVKRLVGTFRAVYALVRGEADWIDTLGYCALITKAPVTAEALKQFVSRLGDTPPTRELNRAFGGRFRADALVNEMIAGPEDSPGVRTLLEALFPALRGEQRNAGPYVEPLSSLYTLNAVLRLGAVSDSSWSRADLTDLSKRPPPEIAAELASLETSGKLSRFVDRVRDLYADLPGFEHARFWRGVSLALAPATPTWDKRYVGKAQVIDGYGDILMRWNATPSMRETLKLAFASLIASGDITLVSQLLRQHAATHGLDGGEPRGESGWFLTRSETQAALASSATAWRALHVEDQLMPRVWELSPLHVIHAAGLWDKDCTQRLTESLRTSVAAFDAVMLLLFGPEASSGLDGVRRFLDEDTLKGLVGERMGVVRTPPGAEGPGHEQAVATVIRDVRGTLGYRPDAKLSSWVGVTPIKPAA